MFGTRALEVANSTLAAENRDLRDTLRSERDAWAKERKDLVDRIIALTKPQAHAAINPVPHIQLQHDNMIEAKQRRINHPGYSTRPPLPPYPKRAGESKPPEVAGN
jgi:hypothetical protein